MQYCGNTIFIVSKVFWFDNKNMISQFSAHFKIHTARVVMGLLFVLYCCFCQVAIAAPAEVQAPPSSDSTNVAEVAPAAWSLYGQFTNVTQWHPAFTSPYEGPNSLDPHSDNNETSDLTVYAGYRIWPGGEIWANAEIDQGFGLSDTLGVAGFPNGEAYKVGENTPYIRLPRLFYRQVIGLGGNEQVIGADINQMGGSQLTDNIALTVGKFSVVDVFDTNTYAHDPRSDFLNWSIADSGAFDYAADAWGYTYGGTIEWTQSTWTLRGGLFDLSKYPNTTTLDPNFDKLNQVEWVGELERRYQWEGRPGKIKLLGYINEGNMGSYEDAVRLAQQTNSTPNTALVRHETSQPGFAVNLEQELTSNLGMFARASMNAGRNETFEFTDINKSVAAGLSLKGDDWGRHDDTFGLAVVANGLSSAARNYFAAGGMGVLIGDGQLPHYDLEKIMETYYSLHAIKQMMLTLDYQYIVNPAYNQDRGPVSVFGIRVHVEF